MRVFSLFRFFLFGDQKHLGSAMDGRLKAPWRGMGGANKGFGEAHLVSGVAAGWSGGVREWSAGQYATGNRAGPGTDRQHRVLPGAEWTHSRNGGLRNHDNPKDFAQPRNPCGRVLAEYLQASAWPHAKISAPGGYSRGVPLCLCACRYSGITSERQGFAVGRLINPPARWPILMRLPRRRIHRISDPAGIPAGSTLFLRVAVLRRNEPAQALP